MTDKLRHKLIYDEAGFAERCSMGDSIDDFFIAKADVHLERMSDNSYWMGLDLPDGTHYRFLDSSETGASQRMVEIERRDA